MTFVHHHRGRVYVVTVGVEDRGDHYLSGKIVKVERTDQ